MNDSNDTVHQLKPSKATLSSPSSSTNTVPRDNVVQLLERRQKQPALPANPSRVERERSSVILRTAATFAASHGAWLAGFEVDHTAEWVFADCSGIIGGGHFERTKRMMRKLTKIGQSAAVPTAPELWSVASVVEIVLAEAAKNDWSFEASEGEFLRAFVKMVERSCEENYRLETKLVP